MPSNFQQSTQFYPTLETPFLSKITPEDRCHLNGLALENGKCKYVTVVSKSDVVDGWRNRRHDGGCVLEVPTGETIVSGLSMPHSPRVYRGELYVHNSGTGYFGKVDRKKAYLNLSLSAQVIFVEWLFPETMQLSASQGHAKIKPSAAFNWIQNYLNEMQKLGADCK